MSKSSLPPGPEQAFSLNADEQSFELIGSLLSEYGDIVSLPSPEGKPAQIIINHPDYIKEVFVTEHKSMQKGTGFDRVKILLGNGLIVSDGEFWQRQKRMIQPMFHKNVLQKVHTIMCECNIRLVENWKTKTEQGKNINVTKDTCYLALEIILRALFSEDYDEMSYKGVNPFFVLAEHTERDLDLVVKFHNLGKYVTRCMQDRIEHERYPDDLLSMLMLTEDKITQERMTEKEVLDEVMTLIVAAHETTAATVNWIWYFLSEYDQVLAGIRDEIDRLESNPPNFEALQKLPYIRQVIDEALRMYPPGWLLSREAIEDVELGGYQLEAGTNIFISPYFVHRHEKFWQQPEQFDPHRFSESNAKQINRYAYFPFSMGQRRCPGEIFALIEMQVHFAYVCKHLDMKYIKDMPITLEPLINLRTQQDFYMQAQPRH